MEYKINLIDMDRAEKILREQLKIDKSFGFGKLMWELHKNTLKKCMQIYVEEQLLLHNVSQQRELLKKWWKYFDEESIAINCNDEEREEVINNFFNCG